MAGEGALHSLHPELALLAPPPGDPRPPARPWGGGGGSPWQHLRCSPNKVRLPTAACWSPLQTCLDINECLSVSQLDPNCTCERCACKNLRGGYE